jgi:D-alanine-D-alanine ligase
LAFEYGSEVIIEANFEGREITNEVYRDEDGTKVLTVTEIISENEFYDYEAKYKGKSNEVTPAELTDLMTTQIQSLTKETYGFLGMKGIVRMDYIVNDGGTPFLIEINSVPGMSKESILPQMASFDEI